MDIQFDVSLEKKDIFKYNMRHTYTNFSGWLSIILAVVIVVVAIVTRERIGATYMALYIILAVAFLLYYPLHFLIKANTLFAVPDSGISAPFHFIVDERGITAQSGGSEETAGWELVYKAIKTKEAFYLYTSRVNAYIFPFRFLNGRENELADIFREKLPAYRRNFK